MSPQLVDDWFQSVTNGNDPDCQDAAMHAIEVYLRKGEKSFENDAKTYAFLSICFKRHLLKLKINEARRTLVRNLPDEPGNFEEQLAEENVAFVKQLLSQLPEIYREALTKFLQGATIQESAEEAGVSLSCAYKRYERAVKIFRSCYRRTVVNIKNTR